jgi:oligoendopeptidase F
MTSTGTSTRSSSDTLPRWDLSSVFPNLDSREFGAATEGLGADLDRLAELYDRRGVRDGQRATPTAADLSAFDEVVAATNDVLDQARTLRAYLSGLLSTDARDDRAATVFSRLQATLAGLQKLSGRFEAWVARFGVDALISGSEVAADHVHALQQAAVSATPSDV